jgi:glycosyltransferase involved in cell wall biosynthesis
MSSPTAGHPGIGVSEPGGALQALKAGGSGATGRRVLMVAFHYPPWVGSSGYLRTLKFSRYLPEHGWRPIVLTAQPRAYPRTTDQQLGEIPEAVVVRRTFALDARRHLAIRGSSLRVTALPDQWSSWWVSAVPAGLRLVREHRPAVLWSTYPIATAHLIGLTLHRLTGLPWVADFRDSMTEDDYPVHPLTRRMHRWIERRVVEESSLAVFTATSARRMYLDRYRDLPASRCVVIGNGYDEADFEGFSRASQREATIEGPVRLLHGGLIYREERDPRPFFRALARLRQEGRVHRGTLQVELRAPGTDSYYQGLVTELGIDDIVRILPALPYREALREAAGAGALLVLQGASCNHQIPAKAYEYLRLNKPILALTGPGGDTAALLAACGGATAVDLLDENGIYHALPGFLTAVQAGTHPLPDLTAVSFHARHNQAAHLASCLAELLGARRP